MKFASCIIAGRETVVLVDPTKETVWPLDVGTMIELIRDYAAHADKLRPVGPGISFSKANFQAPIPRPARNVFCVGRNYHDHAQEFSKSGFDTSVSADAAAVPDHPVIFTKPPESVIGPNASIEYPAGVSQQIDYEAELAVVIGRQGRSIAAADAHRYVFGYTIVNDVTARDLQARHKQWFIGKGLDTFCPMGPWIETADEDPKPKQVRCWVNGELRQSAVTSDLIFDIPTIIETLSAGMTLYPGDVIATGTPAGVGFSFNPPRFLTPGDIVKIEIDGLGSLSNTVVDRP